jgi:hypothetical protein
MLQLLDVLPCLQDIHVDVINDNTSRRTPFFIGFYIISIPCRVCFFKFQSIQAQIEKNSMLGPIHMSLICVGFNYMSRHALFLGYDQITKYLIK